MKTNKNLALALTISLALFVAAEKSFAEEDVIRVEIVQAEPTQAQKQQAYLDDLSRALDESSRQDSIEQQQFLDNRVNTNRLIRAIDSNE